MRTILFASYKGGVGRTLAAVSISNLLARCGYNVVLVDLDVDAPGASAHYGTPAWPTRDSEPARGVVDWATAPERKHLEDVPLDPFLINVPLNGEGSLRLLPAGTVTDAYLETLVSLRWRDWFELHPAAFAEGFKKSLQALDPPPDYVMIDGKAGLAPVTGTVLGLSDAVAFLFGGDPDSIRVIADLTARAPRSTTVFPVLSRYPNYLDPHLSLLSDRLESLPNPDALSYLHAVPGREASIGATVSLDSVDEDSSLAAEHVRLAGLLTGIGEIRDRNRNGDDRLHGLLAVARDVPQIDFKLFRGVAKGRMINLADHARNVAFKVSTIDAVFGFIASEMGEAVTEEVQGQIFFRAGETAGKAFGEAIATDLRDFDLAERLRAWCEFDTATGFGAMTVTERESMQGRSIEVRVRDAFLSQDGGARVLEGYVHAVASRLAGEKFRVGTSWSNGDLVVTLDHFATQ